LQTELIIVLITTSGIDEAGKISKLLLEKKKAACVNIIPGISSSFWWLNKIEKAPENLLLVKTKASLLNDLIKLVKQNHSYEVPEIIALPIIGGNIDYLNWLNDVFDFKS
jgi:periplasmic divalent cation tolerance protein